METKTPSSAAEEAAARVVGEGEEVAPEKRKRGRPRGSKAKKHSPGAAAPIEPTQEDIEAAASFASLWGLLWKIGGSQLSLRELTPEESHALGSATVPVAKKYAEWLGPYAPEVNLALVFVGLVVHTYTKKEKAEAEEVTPNGG